MVHFARVYRAALGSSAPTMRASTVAVAADGKSVVAPDRDQVVFDWSTAGLSACRRHVVGCGLVCDLVHDARHHHAARGVSLVGAIPRTVLFACRQATARYHRPCRQLPLAPAAAPIFGRPICALARLYAPADARLRSSWPVARVACTPVLAPLA